MDWEALVPILFFAIPLVISLLDKRAKKQKGVPPVQARPVFPQDAEDDPEDLPGKRPAAPDPSQPAGWAPRRAGNRGPRKSPDFGGGPAEGGYGFPGRSSGLADTAQPDVFRGDLPDRNQAESSSEEGRRAIHREAKKQTEPEDGAQQKLEIDKKKLILYSEILKPKFDA